MYLLYLICVWIIFGIMFVEWKSWREYYPTILYYCVLNLLYDFLYYKRTLWAFKTITTDFLNHTIISMTFFFIIMPIVILIFLQRFPKRRKLKIVYIFIWAFLFWIIEFLYAQKGMLIYDNNWSVWHSGWFDLLMFSFLRLHYVRPLLTLLLTLISSILFIYLFKIPLEALK